MTTLCHSSTPNFNTLILVTECMH